MKSLIARPRLRLWVELQATLLFHKHGAQAKGQIEEGMSAREMLLFDFRFYERIAVVMDTRSVATGARSRNVVELEGHGPSRLSVAGFIQVASSPNIYGLLRTSFVPSALTGLSTISHSSEPALTFLFAPFLPSQ